MNKILQLALIISFVIPGLVLNAGNPDRQGEAGAAELLFNPWARSAGLHSMNTASVIGVDAMRLNIAGLSRVTKRELVVGSTRLYEGADLRLNALGYAQRIGKNGAFGLSLVSVDFGDIPVTTTALPGGTGATFSPGFFHFGVGYSHTYDNKISVGILLRTVSESLSDINAFGMAIDAGVQYVSGDNDNFRLGISLRNVGTKMSFNGEGLAVKVNPDIGDGPRTLEARSQPFELPSVLNIGASYDFFLPSDIIIRAVGNFTSNAFSRDQMGGGVEVMFKQMFTVRAAYKSDIGPAGQSQNSLYSGLAAGISAELPLQKAGTNKIGIDYAYRATNPFRGSHNFTLRLSF